ncbi:methylmalonyl Co-A mutase-associated GTPase MeaB [Zavarzinia compransoris]|uniref:ArgK/MeaB family GTPase n=1 Tax=Zavarzinia marina TaxID=2911065 RepID=UPI001F44C1BC|nr:GTP-binding protein [Zavarzinia marina]MCF4166890.1 methylmalonyl Co-A mutase-associated GTPase MeaB [Zavarzinia marina]
MTLDDLRGGGKAAMARALARIERDPHGAETIALLDAAWTDPRGHVIGLTGPPGVGKSTLTSALINRWRKAGLTVGVIAVDPSSRRTGGALLGDRTRLIVDPEDKGIFVRSMAARDRLGGLAALTFPAMVLMRAAYDRVLIETVGVGQSETDVTQVADTVVFCVQPASGDSLQFMKAGIVEIPHIAVVTKADLGAPATRARADLAGALSLSEDVTGWKVPVVLVSSTVGEGMATMMDALDRHAAHLAETGAGAVQRADQGAAWLAETVRDQYGKSGLARAAAPIADAAGASPFGRAAGILEMLSRER